MNVKIQPIPIEEYKDAVRDTANSMGLAVKEDGLYFSCRVYKPRRVLGLELPTRGLSLKYSINHDGRRIDSLDAEGNISEFEAYVTELQRRFERYAGAKDAVPEAV